MTRSQTEQLHDRAIGLDALPLAEVADILAHGQQQALATLPDAAAALAAAGTAMANALRADGILHYAAAGSSGLMAMADACELAGTFGVSPSRIQIHMAGGIPQDASMPGNTEDDTDAARRAGAAFGPDDAVILLSASGSTPYVLELAELANAVGATRICIANNADTALLHAADIAVCLPTPPEVLAGSTRMGAGTAQKAALNIMSTVMGVALGHVHDGMMVNVRADNAKLRDRAARMVAQISGVDEALARNCLDATDGEVKPATLLAAGAKDVPDAEARMHRAEGNLRAALAAMTCHD